MARVTPRGRSLGTQVLVAGALLFVAPLAFVAAAAGLERVWARVAELRVETCADAVSEAWRAERALDADVARCARDHLRVRLIEGEPPVPRELVDALVSESSGELVGDLLYGPERRAALASWPEDVPASAALACEDVPAASVRVCSTARALERGAERAVVHVTGSSRSAAPSRHAWRRELVGMTVFGALIALVGVLWLRRRVTFAVRALARDLESLAAARDARLDEARPRELAEVASAFNRLRERLARADAQNEAFLADLAHEMKSPVAAIAAAAEALEAPGSDDPARRARLAQSIAASAARLDRAVVRFLELARAEAGLAGDEREPLDVAELARGVLSTTHVPDDRRLALDAEPAPLVVDAVPPRLEAALRNLIDNALSFARSEVRVSARREGEHAILAVTDDGPGIPAAELPRVFERFYSGRADGRGTGLGLAIVRATATAHGGEARARSEVERGTTLELRLPLRPQS